MTCSSPASPSLPYITSSILASDWRKLATEGAPSQKAIILARYFEEYSSWPPELSQTELTSIIGDRTAHQILTERPRQLTSQTPDLPPQKRLRTGKQPAADSRADTSQSVNYPVRSSSTPTAIDNAAAPAASTSEALCMTYGCETSEYENTT